MFSLKHVIILICCIALIVGMLLLTRKWSLAKKGKGFLIVGLCSEVVKIFFYIIKNEATHGGVLPKSDLPFHLCSIQILLILAVCLLKSEKAKRMILAFMMPSGLVGGAAAMLIPTASSMSNWVITFQYFIYHAALCAFALSILLDKERKLDIHDYFSSLIFIFGIMFFAIYINSIVYDGTDKINFMYVVSPPMDGLPYLTEEHGWLVYIVHYAALVLVAITACYCVPIYRAIKEKRLKKNCAEVCAQPCEEECLAECAATDVKKEE